MLNNTQQVELRRILGYPALGVPIGDPSLASLASAYRMLDPMSWLETRMLTFSDAEEVQIFGSEHAHFANYPQPFGEQYIPEDDSQPTVYGWVPIIRLLQSDVTGSRSFAAFAKADVVGFSDSELAKRRSILREKRQNLADFVGVPLDPDVVGKGKKLYRRR